MTIANSFAVNPAVRNDLPYDSLRDFVPVTSLGITPHVLAVHPSVPAYSVAELVALAKQKPDTLTYGTIGEGSYSHLVGKMFEKAAGIRLVLVPFRGSAPSIVAMTEAGYPGFHSESWYGLVAPAGTPPEVLRRLQREVARALTRPDVKERMAGQSIYGGGETPEEFAASPRNLMTTYASIAKETGIKAQAN